MVYKARTIAYVMTLIAGFVLPAGASAQEYIACVNEQNPRQAQRVCLQFLNSGRAGEAMKLTIYEKLTWAALQQRDYSTSLLWSEKAIAARPSASTYYLAGQALAGLHKFDEAVKMYDAAIKIAPKYVLAFHKRGEAYLELDDKERAREDFETALSFDAGYKPSRIALMRLNQKN